MSRKNNASRGGPLDAAQSGPPVLVFPSALAAAQYISRNIPIYEPYLNRIRFRVREDQPPNMFPSQIGEFYNIEDAMRVLSEQGPQRMISSGPSAEAGAGSGYNAMARRHSNNASRAEHHRQKRQEGWRFSNGVWVQPVIGNPVMERPAWHTAIFSANAAAASSKYNGNVVLHELDRDSLEFLKSELQKVTRANSRGIRDNSIHPGGAVSTIKILLRQNGRKGSLERIIESYPTKLIELKRVEAQRLSSEKRSWQTQWMATGQTNDRFKRLFEYTQAQEQDTLRLIEQLKTTPLSLYTFDEVTIKISLLAKSISACHEYIKNAETASLGRPVRLSYQDRLEECILHQTTQVNILSLSNQILQIAVMIEGIDKSSLHIDPASQNVIIEELYDKLSILKLYSLIDIYGGDEVYGQMCSLVTMGEYDETLRRLTSSSETYRLRIYKGRLSQHSGLGLSFELLERSVFSFRSGIGDALRLLKTARRQGLSTTIREQTGIIYGRVASSFISVLHSLIPEEEFPAEFSDIEQRADLAAPLTIEDVRVVSAATTQYSPRPLPPLIEEINSNVADALRDATEVSQLIGPSALVAMPASVAMTASVNIVKEDEPPVNLPPSEDGIMACQPILLASKHNEEKVDKILQKEYDDIQEFLMRKRIERFGDRADQETWTRYEDEGRLTPRDSVNNNMETNAGAAATTAMNEESIMANLANYMNKKGQVP
jgi:hypothetical protein